MSGFHGNTNDLDKIPSFVCYEPSRAITPRRGSQKSQKRNSKPISKPHSAFASKENQQENIKPASTKNIGISKGSKSEILSLVTNDVKVSQPDCFDVVIESIPKALQQGEFTSDVMGQENLNKQSAQQLSASLDVNDSTEEPKRRISKKIAQKVEQVENTKRSAREGDLLVRQRVFTKPNPIASKSIFSFWKERDAASIKSESTSGIDSHTNTAQNSRQVSLSLSKDQRREASSQISQNDIQRCKTPIPRTSSAMSNKLFKKSWSPLVSNTLSNLFSRKDGIRSKGSVDTFDSDAKSYKSYDYYENALDDQLKKPSFITEDIQKNDVEVFAKETNDYLDLLELAFHASVNESSSRTSSASEGQKSVHVSGDNNIKNGSQKKEFKILDMDKILSLPSASPTRNISNDTISVDSAGPRSSYSPSQASDPDVLVQHFAPASLQVASPFPSERGFDELLQDVSIQYGNDSYSEGDFSDREAILSVSHVNAGSMVPRASRILRVIPDNAQNNNAESRTSTFRSNRTGKVEVEDIYNAYPASVYDKQRITGKITQPPLLASHRSKASSNDITDLDLNDTNNSMSTTDSESLEMLQNFGGNMVQGGRPSQNSIAHHPECEVLPSFIDHESSKNRKGNTTLNTPSAANVQGHPSEGNMSFSFNMPDMPLLDNTKPKSPWNIVARFRRKKKGILTVTKPVQPKASNSVWRNLLCLRNTKKLTKGLGMHKMNFKESTNVMDARTDPTPMLEYAHDTHHGKARDSSMSSSDGGAEILEASVQVIPKPSFRAIRIYEDPAEKGMFSRGNTDESFPFRTASPVKKSTTIRTVPRNSREVEDVENINPYDTESDSNTSGVETVRMASKAMHPYIVPSASVSSQLAHLHLDDSFIADTTMNASEIRIADAGRIPLVDETPLK